MNRQTLPHDDEHADADRKFSAFFKAQLPREWPQAPVAKSGGATRAASHRESHNGRLTLAASVACLLGLGLALSYGPGFNRAAPPAGGLLPDSNANGKDLHDHMTPDHKPKLPMP